MDRKITIKINLILILIILLNVLSLAENRITDQKCSEYQKLCKSGSDPINSKGGEAAPKEFPYMAAIGYENMYRNNGIQWLCSGSLISENFVLTSAECAKQIGSLMPRYVTVGDLNIQSHTDDARPRRYNIIEIFAHPSHSPGARYNDIALFKIDGPVEFSEYAKPACLADTNTNIAERVLVTGWGTISYLTITQGFIYDKLNKIPMNTITYSDCNEVYLNRDTVALPNGINNRTQLCAGTNIGERDACRGFSGAPLLNTIEKKGCLYEVAGINSISLVCGSGLPTVYTRVSGFLDWIEDIVWSGGNGTIPEIPTSTQPPPVQSEMANRTFVKKCKDYHDALYEISPNPSNLNEIDVKSLNCPFGITPHIVDGIAADSKEFPHMALIGFDSGNKNQNIVWGCGGTLISEEFVLTAAHCLDTVIFGLAKYVLLGDLDYSRDDDDAQPLKLNVAERIKYPTYSSKYKYDDIALLRMDRIVSFNDYMRPACLPEFSAIGFQAMATGWGRIDNDRPLSSYLQKVELDLFTHNECDRIYSLIKDRHIDRGILNDTQLCAGSHSGRGDTCQGDSGGPLQNFHHKHFCMYTIVGVTSFGRYCGTKTPGVYTRVYSYVDWIETIVWPN